MRLNRMARIGAVLIAILSIVGCNGVGSAFDRARLAKMIPLEESEMSTTVNTSTGYGTFYVSFDDRTIQDASRLRDMWVTQTLESDVNLAVPAGQTMPAFFELLNLDLGEIKVHDTGGARKMSRRAYVAGPIRFNRVGTSNTYRATSKIEIEFTTIIEGADLATLLAVLQDAPKDNVCEGWFNYEVSGSVPDGSTIGFTFGASGGSVSLN